MAAIIASNYMRIRGVEIVVEEEKFALLTIQQELQYFNLKFQFAGMSPNNNPCFDIEGFAEDIEAWDEKHYSGGLKDIGLFENNIIRDY